MTMRHAQKTTSGKGAWQRMLMAFIVVVALHGLFFFAIHMKTLRLPPSLAQVSSDEETLNVWAMSNDDRSLSPEAADVLAWAAMKEAETSASAVLPLFDPASAGVNDQQKMSPKAIASLRLDWSNVTTELDGFLSTPEPLLVASIGVQRLLASNGLLARQYDLRANSLEIPLDIGRQSASRNRISGIPMLPPWPESPGVIVSKYEDSAWESLSAEELSRQGAAILSQQPKDAVPQEWTEPYEVHLDVSMGGQRVSRIHLRQSSGIPALDDVVMEWVQKRHATSGHHHTDAPLTTQEHRVEYIVEFTRQMTP